MQCRFRKQKLVNILNRLYRDWVTPVCDPVKGFAALRAYDFYIKEWARYRKMQGAEPILLRDSHPCLYDRTARTHFDSHYFYQAAWAMERILHSALAQHIDLGSDVQFVGLLATQMHVTFIDIRPCHAVLPRLSCVCADILALPFADGSVESLSCLHVAEHVGLGRYGDALDPLGTQRACAELTRVLAPQGNLFFSVPVGRPRVCFNAHRIHSPYRILDYFYGLNLREFSAVDDKGKLRVNAKFDEVEGCAYACGLFWFRRDME